MKYKLQNNETFQIENLSGQSISIDPSVGITENDLSSSVQASLEKADTAVQDVQLSNGTSIVNNTIATLPGIYQHNISFDGDSTTSIFLTMIMSTDAPFDVPSFITYINTMSMLGNNPGIVCEGTVRTNSSGIATGRTASRIVPGTSNTSIGIMYHDTGDAGIAGPIQYSEGTGANNIHSLSDAVIKIM